MTQVTQIQEHLEEHLEEEWDLLRWTQISGDPDCIYYIEQHLLNTPECWQQVDWTALSGNSDAGHILANNLHKVNWTKASANPGAIDILYEHVEKIVWSELCKNPAGRELMAKNPKQWNSMEHDIDSDFYFKNELHYILK
jgi:hypothetical protein